MMSRAECARSLGLPPSTSDAELQRALRDEMRLWTQRLNAPTMEVQDQARRRVSELGRIREALELAPGQTTGDGPTRNTRTPRAETPVQPPTTPPMPAGPAPGFYPDPVAPGQSRYWTGSAWSEAGGPSISHRSKVSAGVLGILVGALGIHNFYIGQTGRGLAQLLITVLSLGFLAFIPAIWGLVEGIMILTNAAPLDGDGRVMR